MEKIITNRPTHLKRFYLSTTFLGIILFLGFYISLNSVNAQSTVTIGTGTTNKDYGVNNYYYNARAQFIYLSENVGSASSITHIAFDVANVPSRSSRRELTNFKIKYKEISNSTDNFSSDAFQTGLTEVYSATEVFSSTEDWRTFDVTDFDYDGTSNLLIEISYGTNSSYTSDEYELETTSGTNRCVYAGNDSELGETMDADDRANYYANIKLTVQTGPTISSGSLSGSSFTSCSGAAGAERSFLVTGSSLTGDLTVTPPPGYEVSTTSGSGFNSSSITLAESGGSVSTTVCKTDFFCI
jgi:hypothetical protein